MYCAWNKTKRAFPVYISPRSSLSFDQWKDYHVNFWISMLFLEMPNVVETKKDEKWWRRPAQRFTLRDSWCVMEIEMRISVWSFYLGIEYLRVLLKWRDRCCFRFNWNLLIIHSVRLIKYLTSKFLFKFNSMSWWWGDVIVLVRSLVAINVYTRCHFPCTLYLC